MSVRVQVKVLVEGDQARKVRLLDFEDEVVWVPESQIESAAINTQTRVGTLTITDWIAKKIGVEE